MANKGTACPVKNCPRFISPRSSLKVCTVCRGRTLWWGHRGLGAVLEYREKLEMRNDRLDYAHDVVKADRRKHHAKKKGK